jgi:hypothetical protein
MNSLALRKRCPEDRIHLGRLASLATSINPASQEFTMHTLRIFTALSVAVLMGACANPGPMSASSASASRVPMAMGTSGAMATPDSRMKAMQEMHQKMVNASTPAERQALMADHMKAMQGGMAMMKEMHSMHGGGGMGGMGGMGMPTDMSKRHQMMADHMAMMQMMMDMMADRMPPASAVK